ncbi:MAG: 50S ribosomal protein L14 [bacterium]
MIQKRTKLAVADNSGAKIAECIGILGGTKHRYAKIGDIINVAIKSAEPRATVKKGEVQKAVVVRQKNNFHRQDSSYIRFDDNAVVILDGFEPKGSRLFGPMPYELRQRFPKIISLAQDII